VEFIVVLRKAEEGGYWAEVPNLEGCFTQGDTVEEVLNSAKDAISSHLAALAEDGQVIPEEGRVIVATVRVPQPV